MTLPRLIAERAAEIVASVVQTDYQHHTKIDAQAGIYDCDCNGFLGYVLSDVAPRHYALVPCEADQVRPRAFEYHDFFASLSPDADEGWQRIDRLEDARPGDIIAWRFPAIEAHHDTGHVMIVAAPPVADAAERYSVRLYDSSAKAHFDDTRAADAGPFPTGVGEGTIRFTVDADGKPVSFLFAPPDTAAFQTLPIAIGRLTPL